MPDDQVTETPASDAEATTTEPATEPTTPEDATTEEPQGPADEPAETPDDSPSEEPEELLADGLDLVGFARTLGATDLDHRLTLEHRYPDRQSGHYTLDVTPTVRVVVPRTGDVGNDANAIADAVEALLKVQQWATAEDATQTDQAVGRVVFPPRDEPKPKPDRQQQSGRRRQASQNGNGNEGGRQRARPGEGRGARRDRGGGNAPRVELYCPDHPWVQMSFSPKQYQPKEDGELVWDRLLCPSDKNESGENHNVWKRNGLSREEAEAAEENGG